MSVIIPVPRVRPAFSFDLQYRREEPSTLPRPTPFQGHGRSSLHLSIQPPDDANIGTDEQSLQNPRNFTGEDAEIPQSTLLHFGKGRQCLCTMHVIGRTTMRCPSQAHYSTLDLCHRCARGTYQPRVKLFVVGHLLEYADLLWWYN